MFTFIRIDFKSLLYIELQSTRSWVRSCSTVEDTFYTKLLKATPTHAPHFRLSEGSYNNITLWFSSKIFCTYALVCRGRFISAKHSARTSNCPKLDVTRTSRSLIHLLLIGKDVPCSFRKCFINRLYYRWQGEQLIGLAATINPS